MTAYDDTNIFARILRGEIPCKKVYENDHVLAFEDIAPKAPVHILIIPRGRYVSIDDFGQNASPEEASALFRAVHEIASSVNISGPGFRTIANTGQQGGQEVPHFHLHILGGRDMGAMVADT